MMKAQGKSYGICSLESRYLIAGFSIGVLSRAAYPHGAIRF